MKLPLGLKSKSGKKFGKRGSFFGNLFSTSSKDLVSPSDGSNSSSTSPKQNSLQQRNKMSSKAAKLLGVDTTSTNVNHGSLERVINADLDSGLSFMSTGGTKAVSSPIDVTNYKPHTPSSE